MDRAMTVILVTGSRDWKDAATIRWTMDSSWLFGHARAPLALRVGDARGADALAAAHARQSGWEVQVYHPDWAANGHQAGYMRNAEMVAHGADFVLAYVSLCDGHKRTCTRGPHATHGSAHCLGIAIDAGIMPYIFGPAAHLYERENRALRMGAWGR
jgi:hypothetical protein